MKIPDSQAKIQPRSKGLSINTNGNLVPATCFNGVYNPTQNRVNTFPGQG